jgi:magnesium transporter
MIKFYHKTIEDKKLSVLNDFKIGSWIYIEKPSEKELEFLTEKFSFEPGLLKDAIDPYEVPRLEVDNGTLYIFTRVPFREQGKVITVPILIAISPNYVLTVAQNNLPFLQKFIDGGIEFNTTKKTNFFLQIFSQIILLYNNFLTNISRGVRSGTVRLKDIGNEDIVRFVNFESILNDFLAALLPTNAILNNLLSGKFLELYEEDKDLIEDLFLGNNQLIELAKINLKTIVNIRESYSTIMSNNLNRVMKLLTALTIIITVPTTIINFYSMNVRLPFAQSPWAFWIVLGATLVLALILLGIFITKKWL